MCALNRGHSVLSRAVNFANEWSLPYNNIMRIGFIGRLRVYFVYVFIFFISGREGGGKSSYDAQRETTYGRIQREWKRVYNNIIQSKPVFIYVICTGRESRCRLSRSSWAVYIGTRYVLRAHNGLWFRHEYKSTE